MELTENHFNSNGVRLYYVQAGEGQPVILCHGNGEDCSIFYGLIKILSKNFSVFALDTRGHGKSEPIETLHYADMGRDIINLIKYENLHKPIIIGFSDGAISALEAAKIQADVFSKLVLAGANLNPKGLKWYAKLSFRIANLFKYNDRLRLMLKEPNILPEELQKIDALTLVLAGQNDIVKEKQTRLLASSLKNSTLKILHGEQHQTYVFDNDKFYSAIEDFIM